jgi:hypothetical protein
MNISTKFFCIVAITAILSSKIIFAQTVPGKLSAAEVSQQDDALEKRSIIKWTRQLPASVKKDFNNSRYAHWYIAGIIKIDSSGKTVYRFYINNRNLLDGDHYDSFFSHRHSECRFFQLNIKSRMRFISNRPLYLQGFFNMHSRIVGSMCTITAHNILVILW